MKKNSHEQKENATSAKSLNKREEDVGNVVAIGQDRSMTGNDINGLDGEMADGSALPTGPSPVTLEETPAG